MQLPRRGPEKYYISNLVNYPKGPSQKVLHKKSFTKHINAMINHLASHHNRLHSQNLLEIELWKGTLDCLLLSSKEIQGDLVLAESRNKLPGSEVEMGGWDWRVRSMRGIKGWDRRVSWICSFQLTVALIKGEGSPTAERHSALMKMVTSVGNLLKWAFALFLRISLPRDRVASSWSVILVRT